MEQRRRRRRHPRNIGPSQEIMAQWTEAERAAHRTRQCLQTPIAEMQLSVRCVNTLESLSIILCGDLMSKSVDELMEIANFGETTLKEIIKAVKLLGLKPPWKTKRRATKKPAAKKRKR